MKPRVPRADTEIGSHSGSAYVFVRGGTTSSEQQNLPASDGEEDEWFGGSVAISGNTTVIGAHRDDDKGADSGSTYVFVRSGDTWREQQKLIASDGEAEHYFGYSVAVSGNTTVIGAYRDDDKGLNAGSAYIYKAQAAMPWMHLLLDSD